ncbi:ATP-grasp domain-containing protein [Brevundimonas lutea]|uniref:ATP-grasp domain-containing protein n=1 Tax=Brevundimonas lutea TaxID=2293980 RepID=UPI000F012E43|nr:transporter [Brevundimonas lutea]
MARLAILTPDPTDPSYASHWPGVVERLTAPLAADGHEVTAAPWTDHVEDASGLEGFDLILPLVVWGYHREHVQWRAACETWQRAGLPVANPPSVLNWNSDKSYLGRLAEAGVAIPQTLFVDRVDAAAVEAALAQFGAPVIVKPVVSGGAWRTLKLSSARELIDGPQERAMIQPYLPAIEQGELSLLWFGGRLSHAVRKRPAAGDFRIQVQYGGLYEAVEAPNGAVALAEQVLGAIEEDLLYARIDMVEDAEHGWLLMEAELIEPDFYLGQAPDGGAAFAEAVARRLAG